MTKYNDLKIILFWPLQHFWSRSAIGYGHPKVNLEKVSKAHQDVMNRNKNKSLIIIQ